MSIGLNRSCVAKRLVVLAVPTPPQVRDHQEIHHRKADQAGQEPLLHDTAHQPPWVQLADHQLSSPKDRHLHGKRSEGETPFRCTETKHCQQSADDTQSADPLRKATKKRKQNGWRHSIHGNRQALKDPQATVSKAPDPGAEAAPTRSDRSREDREA